VLWDVFLQKKLQLKYLIFILAWTSSIDLLLLTEMTLPS
jgi:hypothetical protein